MILGLMKTTVSSQQLVYFRRHGRIRFENFPLNFTEIKNEKSQKAPPRDLWRTSPFLKKIIFYTLGPIALELTKKPSIRLACDQWLSEKSTTTRMQDMFCFQGLSCIFVLYEDASTPQLGTILEVFEPSSLANLLPQDGYLIAFALENGVLIDNPKDPFTATTRNLGYVYGDRLLNAHHPLICQK